MATLEEVIQREVNPFDSWTFRTGNFWTENDRSAIETVESIHKEEIEEITEILNLVAKDHRTRTILLAGDSGCGKSYSLGRLKKNLNSQAFFAYIEPAPSSDCTWQHTLRYTVDSLLHIPEGEKESQLILWLKSLYAFNVDNLKKKLLGQKRNFIQEMRATYPTGIYQPRDFFAVLYELTDQNNYFLACDWLRGDNLDRDDLKALGVNNVIDSEQAARGILGNFGRISRSTLPIVLCFDQVELAPRLPDGTFDIGWAFKINTALHNSYLKNFLVILSVVKTQFIANQKNIIQSDFARIDKQILLKRISLEQVEALWASRLSFLHSQVDNKPESAIAPLDKERLEKKYPGGKANLRDSLNFGGKLFLEYKLGRSHDIEEDKRQETEVRSKLSPQDSIPGDRQLLNIDSVEVLNPKVIKAKSLTSHPPIEEDKKQETEVTSKLSPRDSIPGDRQLLNTDSVEVLNPKIIKAKSLTSYPPIEEDKRQETEVTSKLSSRDSISGDRKPLNTDSVEVLNPKITQAKSFTSYPSIEEDKKQETGIGKKLSEEEFTSPDKKTLNTDSVEVLNSKVTQAKSFTSHPPNQPSTFPQKEDNDSQQILAAFKLLWSKELNKTQENITRIRKFSSQELIEMLRQVMNALQVEQIKPRFLSGRNASYSFSYQLPDKTEKFGILWNEEPNLNSFAAAMKACHKVIEENPEHSLILIRAEKLGNNNNRCFKLFKEIFKSSTHRHIMPDLNSVHYLKNYQRLANNARAGDLVVGFETPNLQELQALVRVSKVLHECSLLQDLDIVYSPDDYSETGDNYQGRSNNNNFNEAKELLLSIVTHQHFLGRQILIEQAKSQFPNIDNSQFDQLIQELCQENKIKILDSKAKQKEQLICLVPRK